MYTSFYLWPRTQLGIRVAPMLPELLASWGREVLSHEKFVEVRLYELRGSLSEGKRRIVASLTDLGLAFDDEQQAPFEVLYTKPGGRRRVLAKQDTHFGYDTYPQEINRTSDVYYIPTDNVGWLGVGPIEDNLWVRTGDYRNRARMAVLDMQGDRHSVSSNPQLNGMFRRNLDDHPNNRAVRLATLESLSKGKRKKRKKKGRTSSGMETEKASISQPRSFSRDWIISDEPGRAPVPSGSPSYPSLDLEDGISSPSPEMLFETPMMNYSRVFLRSMTDRMVREMRGRDRELHQQLERLRQLEIRLTDDDIERIVPSQVR